MASAIGRIECGLRCGACASPAPTFRADGSSSTGGSWRPSARQLETGEECSRPGVSFGGDLYPQSCSRVAGGRSHGQHPLSTKVESCPSQGSVSFREILASIVAPPCCWVGVPRLYFSPVRGVQRYVSDAESSSARWPRSSSPIGARIRPALPGGSTIVLRAHFGDDAVFMDIDSIPFGVDFREHIDAAVGQCDVVLAVIGHEMGRGNRRSSAARRPERLCPDRDRIRAQARHTCDPDPDRSYQDADRSRPAALACRAEPIAMRSMWIRDGTSTLMSTGSFKGIEFHFERAKTPAVHPAEPSARGSPNTSGRARIGATSKVIPNRGRSAAQAGPRVEPRPDSPPSTSDPGQLPKAEHQGTDGSKPKARADACRCDRRGAVFPNKPRWLHVGRFRAVSSQLVEAPPKRRKIPWLWSIRRRASFAGFPGHHRSTSSPTTARSRSQGRTATKRLGLRAPALPATPSRHHPRPRLNLPSRRRHHKKSRRLRPSQSEYGQTRLGSSWSASRPASS